MAPAAGDVPANVSGPAKLSNWNKSVFFTAAKLVYPEDVADVQAVCCSCLQLTSQQQCVRCNLMMPCAVPENCMCWQVKPVCTVQQNRVLVDCVCMNILACHKTRASA